MPPRRPISLLLALSVVLGACSTTPAGPTAIAVPSPTCGGVKVLIEDALPCARVVEIAVTALAASHPAHLARGVDSIDVSLAECRDGAVPPQVECAGSAFAQYVRVTFVPAAPGEPVEPSLTVVVAPVDGRVLGIENPLIR